ncbi:peptide deformylase [Candidatus Gracilibacteria bacterium]|nr:peptide deformylase [Candidatus Gracilibacteria bacterium]
MYEIQTGKDNKILRTVAIPVEVFDEELKKIVDQMEETMKTPDPKTKIKGIGLAANQVGILKRIIIVTFNVENSKRQKVIPMINPEILEISLKQKTLEEGCLSLPDQFAKISRPSKVKIRWQNLKGHLCEKRLEKWAARVFLHEYDHLEGKLFIDYLSSKK